MKRMAARWLVWFIMIAFSQAAATAPQTKSPQSKTARQVFQLFDTLAADEQTTLKHERWMQLTAQYGFRADVDMPAGWLFDADDGRVEFTIVPDAPDAPDAQHISYFLTFIPRVAERLPDPVLSWMLQFGATSLTDGDMIAIQLPREPVDKIKKSQRGIDRFVKVRISGGKLVVH